MTKAEKKALQDKKKELTAQIRKLTEERAALCLSDKERKQSNELEYILFSAQKMILLRVLPGCMPTTPALNAGITIMMRLTACLKVIAAMRKHLPIQNLRVTHFLVS